MSVYLTLSLKCICTTNGEQMKLNYHVIRKGNLKHVQGPLQAGEGLEEVSALHLTVLGKVRAVHCVLHHTLAKARSEKIKLLN